MRKSKLFLILFFIIATIIMASCDNEQNYTLTTPVNQISINESIRIRSIEFRTNDIGLLCGGEKNDVGSIYKTTDGGETWIQKYHSDSLSVNNLFYLNDTIVYACGDSLMILKSSDSGNTWNTISLSNEPYEEYYVPYYDIHANSEENIFAVGGEHFYKGLYSETETGNYPWTHTSYDNQFYSMCFVGDYIGFFAGYGIMLVTEDGGNTFDDVTFPDDFFIDMEADSYDNVFALSERGILYSTSDLGYNWVTEIDDSYATFTDMHIGVEKSAVCGWQGLVYTRDNSGSWKEIDDLPQENFYCTYVNSDNEIFLGSKDGNLYILNKKRTP